MQKSYILLNPTNRYALDIMDRAQARFGMLPVVVWTSQREALFWRATLPELSQRAFLGEHYLDQTPAPQLAQQLAEGFALQGVIAYAEQTLEAAANLLEHLPPMWNGAEIMRRFRDKNAVKDDLRTRHPELPMNATRLVRSVEDVLSLPLPEAFVIKPNDGMANRDVAFFRSSVSRSDLDAYFAGNTGRAFILEEFLDGPEYAVNGQIDHNGVATVLNVTEYERVAGNGKPNLYRWCMHVSRTDAAYAPLAIYAKAVMDATGLKRVPFHMEIILTPQGPRMIEVGARFGGLDYVYITQAVHGGHVDPIDMATHYWLSDSLYTGAQGDWETYDAISFLQLDGVSSQNTRIYSLRGMDKIEGLPEFHAWVFKPHVGQLLHVTHDLYTIPYSFQLKARVPRASLRETALRAEGLLEINRQVSAVQRLRVNLREQVRRVTNRGRLVLSQIVSKFS